MLKPGTKLGPYEIVAAIGAGGMGEVYRAADTRLGREVAVKVLPASLSSDPDRVRRFEVEARAGGALNHPNVLAVYDVGSLDGVAYLVTELLEGETLRERLALGPLPVRTALEFGIQIAHGLAVAHAQGIVHRDLKPENLFITRDGQLKILDFGLAKVGPQAPSADARTLDEVPVDATEPGTVLGTVGYIAPEQLRGLVADQRTDIFALGCVLHEMLSGSRPFRGATTAEAMAAVLTQDPPRLLALGRGIPASLQEVVNRCLEKRPDDRYSFAKDVGFALLGEARALDAPAATRAGRRTGVRFWASIAAAVALAAGAATLALLVVRGHPRGGGEPASVRSIAVLPLAIFSTDPEQQFFADAMTDAIITDLAKIGALRVVSRGSVMRYRGTQEPIPEIARKLDVEAVVTGSVERSAGRVRITAQLIRASTDRHMWADSYERDLRDVLLLQDEVARSIAGQIRVQLTPEEHRVLSTVRTVEPEAYELYLKGRYFWNKRSQETVTRAIEYFRQAIERDPAYASAYGGLADCYMSLGFSFDIGALPPNEAIPKAKAAAAKALEIDDTIAEVHNPLAFIKLNYDWDFPGAEREFKRALELNPGYANAHHWYAHFLLATGRTEQALTESKRALELDPLNAIINVHLAWHRLMVREYDGAIEQLLATLELEPGYGLAYWYLGLAYERKARYPEAIAALRKADDLLKGHLVVEADLAYTLAVSGDRPGARRMLDTLMRTSERRYVSPFEVALVHIGLGERDEAFRWLERAYQDRSDLLVYLNSDARLDPIRRDPRFAELVRRVGLPG